MEKQKNLLNRAEEIIYKRSEEKERKYGPFNEGMERAAKIASGITGKNLDANDMFAALIALKFSRISYTNDHEDSYLDAAAYTAQMYEYNKELKSGKAVPKEDKLVSIEAKDAAAYKVKLQFVKDAGVEFVETLSFHTGLRYSITKKISGETWWFNCKSKDWVNSYGKSTSFASKEDAVEVYYDCFN